jgi:CRISPR-associated exonuclease Cas4
MEHTSDIVYDGKLLHETSYPQRAERYTEIEITATFAAGTELSGQIDFYDSKEKMIHEIKRSDKAEGAHEWQVKYYIWLLQQNDIEKVTGVLEYPKLRETKKVMLTAADIVHLKETVTAIQELIDNEQCPPRINKKLCKSCSYYDFCYVEESEE